MKFEGHQVNIPIKGIMRAGTDNLAADGAMNEVVGMEYKDGSWLPYKEKEEEFDVKYADRCVTFKDVYVHKTSDGQERYIFVADANNYRATGDAAAYNIVENDVLYEISRGESVVNVSLLTHDAKDVSFIGNMICISTSTNTEYYLWEEGAYHEQTPDVSNLPVVRLRVTKGVANSDEPENGYTGMKSHSCSQFMSPGTTKELCDAYVKTIRPTLTSKQVGSGLLMKAKGMQTENGGLTGYVMACVAYRMKNGEYVAASAPVLLAPPDIRHANIESRNGYVTKSDNDNPGALITDTHESGCIDPDHYPAILRPLKGLPVSWSNSKVGVLPLYIDSTSSEDPENKTFGDLTNAAAKESEEFYQEGSDMSLFYAGAHPDNPEDDFPEQSPKYVRYNDFVRGASDGYYNIVRPLPLMATIGINYNSSTDEVWLNQIAAGVSNKLQFNFSSNALNNGIELNEDLYDGIGIFISQEIDAFRDMTKENFIDMHGEFRHGYLSENASFVTDKYWAACSYTPQYRDKASIQEDVRKVKSMYLVKFLDTEDIKHATAGTWVDVDLKGLLGDTLVTLQSISMNALIQATKQAGYLSAYNSRLHVFDYKANYGVDTKLDYQNYFGGTGQYDVPEIDKTDWTGNYQAKKLFFGIVVKNDIGNGDIIENLYTWVKSNTPSLSLDNVLESSPILAFKGRNIQSIELYAKMEYKNMGLTPGDHTSYLYQNLSFEKNTELGIAYVLSSALMPFTVPAKTPNQSPWTVDPETTPTWWRSDLESGYVPKDEYIARNGLRVSDVAYPMYFPTEYTYRVGNGRIRGLARLTTPVSQDNFGSNQLIVFCTDGIYAMTVDASGKGAYTTIPPLVSPEVCVNKNSICEIGGAIFFAADKGLMMLTGANQVQQYVPQLNGEPRFLPATTTSKTAEGVYKTMIDNQQILSKSDDAFADSISHEDFINFIKDEHTHLVYISIKNKLLAYNDGWSNGNPLYDFSYLIDIPTGNTTKLAMRAECDDGDTIGKTIWEKRKGVDTYDVHTFEYLSQEDDEIACLVQSRPIKVQQDDKNSYRVVLTGYFEGIADNWADLVVLGSLDGDHWHVIGVKEKKLLGGFHNLGCLTERGTWKYLMFIFGGKLNKDSHIDSVDITVDGRYNNKKR